MADLTLYIGSKKKSSWSLRAWLALRHLKVPFREVVIPLDAAGSQAAIKQISAAGRVPILRHGDLTIWDSLAIGEYLAETFPEGRLWPEHPRARAEARSVCAEMHAGFQALREHMGFALVEERPEEGRKALPLVSADIARIVAVWKDCRHRFGSGGPYLFGAFSLADCFYAPVASRFTTYAVELDAEARGYVETLWALPAMQEWKEGARHE